MHLELNVDDCRPFFVDRDGVRNNCGRQVFCLTFGELTVHFEDERDAVEIARKILYRMGEEGSMISDRPCVREGGSS